MTDWLVKRISFDNQYTAKKLMLIQPKLVGYSLATSPGLNLPPLSPNNYEHLPNKANDDAIYQSIRQTIRTELHKIYKAIIYKHCKNGSVTLTQVELHLHYQTMCKQVNLLDLYRSQASVNNWTKSYTSGSYNQGTIGMLKVQLHL